MRKIDCKITFPSETASALIPPFIIQSFVENSVKYASIANENIKIAILVEMNEDKEYLIIRISDNGVGYSEELLLQNWKQKIEDGHIGLLNIYQRLKLIYDNKAEVKLMNDNGAVVIVKLPYISVDNTEVD